MDEIEDIFCAGLRSMHRSAARAEFFTNVWERREDISGWQLSSLGDRFRTDALPVFLHGGDSRDRVVVVGMNPGWREKPDRQIEDFIQKSAENYRELHEKFYEVFPGYFGDGIRMSPFWTNLQSKLIGMLPNHHFPEDSWRAYEQTCVAEDIIPFHSGKQSTTAKDLAPGTLLNRLAHATFDGLRQSEARQVWVFSREGYQATLSYVAESPDIVADRFVAEGCTRTSRHLRVDVLVARLPRNEIGLEPLPILAVDNALISQPKFPFDEVWCGSTCEPRQTFAEQLRRALG